ncbi:hypothetical protein QUB80_33445 [Chlorogloeopsis sp. ULAP01]|uniref:hypothetical protein n=1 Tax=Chlorogloeopsis sp. ULAP01 TaxID=3056483 RepID=UPI0025AAC987|nr:hypothetical protein [Chlorogloeopsis sp. ULAP01]MDM9385563.1 hypothetical protein [Chlorogloeopsis sp. ULAP01]
MSSFNSKSSTNSDLNLVLFSIPQSFLLQVGTTSVLMLLLAEKATAQTLQAIGEATEEIFRGDRLPILDFPENNLEN